jgi:hypothetical protein
MLPAPAVHGVVLDARTGRPIPRFDVTLSADRATTGYSGDTYAEGRFACDCAGDALHTVTIEAAGYHALTCEHVVPSSTSGAPLVFRLEPDA